MTTREYEIADLSKELPGRIVQGMVMNGAPVDAQQCAALAVQMCDGADGRARRAQRVSRAITAGGACCDAGGA
ncbi:hypothetical protein JFN94_20475 [Burkholderia anthina]|uniref:Uncharacterized protein n=2 Tax=Burkholderiaceae TaxID=119060 RepID=A0A7T6VMY3_9BURK|nr:hypothetical protein [Burkholderia anthina]QQK06863.1 hypothetical protein JFN94_20475 [Burkholderia anthina]